LQQRAAESQIRRYPGDYVYRFVPGDGETFDFDFDFGFGFGFDYVECAGVKFPREQRATEPAPYICPADILYSEALGWGLKRTTTLAQGGARCDFRFRRGVGAQVAAPEPLEQHLRSKRA
jgi:hypothetical protein